MEEDERVYVDDVYRGMHVRIFPPLPRIPPLPYALLVFRSFPSDIFPPMSDRVKNGHEISSPLLSSV